MDEKDIWPQTSVGCFKDIPEYKWGRKTSVDFGTIFANWLLLEYESHQAQEMFKSSFYRQLDRSVTFRAAVETLMGKTLYTMEREPNHANVIADYLNSLADEHNAKLNKETTL